MKATKYGIGMPLRIMLLVHGIVGFWQFETVYNNNNNIPIFVCHEVFILEAVKYFSCFLIACGYRM